MSTVSEAQVEEEKAVVDTNLLLDVAHTLIDAEAQYRSAMNIYKDHPSHMTRIRAESRWRLAKTNMKAALNGARRADDLDELCRACGASKREHLPGGIRHHPQSLCGAFIPQDKPAPTPLGRADDEWAMVHALQEMIRRTRTRLEAYCNEANAGRMPSDAREFMRRVQCGFDSLQEEAHQLLAAAPHPTSSIGRG